MPFDLLPEASDETPDQRQTRQLDWLRHLGHVAMKLAQRAGEEALAPPPPDQPKRTPDPGAAFARYAAAVRQIIATELRITAPAKAANRLPPRSPALDDPRREMLRRAFHEAVVNDPDRARRKREIDAAIDEHLVAHPKGSEPIGDTVAALSETLGITLDQRKLPDALISDTPIPRRPELTSGAPPGWVRPNPWDRKR